MAGVNLAHRLGSRADTGLKLLLRPVVDADEVIHCEGNRVDGMAVRFACVDEQAEAIIHTLRLHYARYRLRYYHSRTGKRRWERV